MWIILIRQRVFLQLLSVFNEIVHHTLPAWRVIRSRSNMVKVSAVLFAILVIFFQFGYDFG